MEINEKINTINTLLQYIKDIDSFTKYINDIRLDNAVLNNISNISVLNERLDDIIIQLWNLNGSLAITVEEIKKELQETVNDSKFLSAIKRPQ